MFWYDLKTILGLFLISVIVGVLFLTGLFVYGYLF